MAKDMLPLDQEMAAFGEEMPKPKFTKKDCEKPLNDATNQTVEDLDENET